MGNSIKWDGGGIEVGMAGKGKIVLREDEIALKMSAAALGVSLMSGLSAMALI